MTFERLFVVKRGLWFGSIAAVLLSSGFLLSKSGVAGQTDALVRLQQNSPGVQQIGNANISGVIKAGSLKSTAFQLGTSATAGRVLMTDSTGNGTWQNVPGPTMPYAGSTSSSGATAFSITNTSGDGLSGISNATGFNFGVYGQTDSSLGKGVYGVATSPTGSGQGGHFETASSAGYGVAGVATSTSGTNYGVFGQSLSTTGAGVFGKSTSTTYSNYGVYGLASGPINTGVRGDATYGSNQNIGVWGEDYSPDGFGVLGQNVANSGEAIGVRGGSVSPTGIGIFGFNGALGTTMVAYGVYGDANGVNSYGVFSSGRLGATGTKSFVIDDPLDPENKILHHYCAEGPEPRNVYQGSVTTDGEGFAWVALPDYFGSINKDPLYQLTVVDSSSDFVLAKVTKEIEENRFQIRTSKPRVKVCWRVDAVRNDRWVQKYGAPAITEKDEVSRGKYLSPELYDEPDGKAIVSVNPIHGGTRHTHP